MLTFAELVDQLRSPAGAGFDVPKDQAEEVLNRVLKRFASLSKWITEEVELGPTVAGQDIYEVDENIIEIHELYVDGADTQRVSSRDIMRLNAGVSWLRNGPPWTVFTDRETAEGVKELQIYPVPMADGASLLGFCSVLTPDLLAPTVNNNFNPPFPDDMEDALLDGARAILYRDLDENPEMGDYYQAKFEAQGEVLRRRGNKRVGSGAFQIKVVR